jgi:hypothetical protein
MPRTITALSTFPNMSVRKKQYADCIIDLYGMDEVTFYLFGFPRREEKRKSKKLKLKH